MSATSTSSRSPTSSSSIGGKEIEAFFFAVCLWEELTNRLEGFFDAWEGMETFCSKERFGFGFGLSVELTTTNWLDPYFGIRRTPPELLVILFVCF